YPRPSWPRLEERPVLPVHRADEERAVEILVSTLTGSLGGKETGVAGRAVESDLVPLRPVLRPQRVRGAKPHPLQRLIKVPPQHLRFPQAHKPPERALAVRRRCVNEHPRHGLRPFLPGPGANAL